MNMRKILYVLQHWFLSESYEATTVSMLCLNKVLIQFNLFCAFINLIELNTQ